MTFRLAHRGGRIALAGATVALGSVALSSCVLSKIHTSSPSYRVITGRCVFLGTTTATRFAHCNYSRANFSGDNAPGIDFNETSWVGAQMTDVQMQSSSFLGAVFAHANLSGSNFNAANFNHANFAGADLTNAIFSDASLHAANFVETDLRGAKSLTAAAVAGSRWRATTCPDGTNSNHDGGTCNGHLRA